MTLRINIEVLKLFKFELEFSSGKKDKKNEEDIVIEHVDDGDYKPLPSSEHSS